MSMRLNGKLRMAIGIATLACPVFAGSTQTGSAFIKQQPDQVVTCAARSDMTELRLHDEATANGALIENANLITLPNGLKAATFSARYAPRLYSSKKILMVRYTVVWTDTCGRTISLGSNHTEGFALNPRQTIQAQATAFSRDARFATLRIYVENPDQTFTSQTLP